VRRPPRTRILACLRRTVIAKRSGPLARAVRSRDVPAGGQLTLTALHAAATALCWVEPAPYKSAAALSVAARAWA